MTIGKKLSVLTVTLITVLAVLLLLGSCSKADNSQVLEQLESLRDSQTEEEEVGDGYSRYRIVVPENCSGQIWEAAERISAYVFEITGKDCSIVKDCENVSAELGVGEILLGYTVREASRELLAALSRDDYICAPIGAAVVLGGRSEGATLEAAERFLSENTVTENGILTVSDGFEYFCQYEYKGAVLWNNRLGSMTVVCSAENGRLARLFVDAVADRCGDYPEIVYGEKGTDGSRELLFNVDKSIEDFARISYDGEDVHIVSNTEYGLSVAAFGLIERLFDGNGEMAEVSGDREITFIYEIPCISVGVMRAELSEYGELSYLLGVDRYISNADLDVLLINGVDDAAVAKLRETLDSTYAFHLIKMEGETRAVAVYKTDRLLVKTAEMTNAHGCNAVSLVFEDKKDGRAYGLLDFFVTDLTDSGWTETVSQSLANSTGISFALLTTAQTSSDFCVPQGAVTVYSAENVLNGDGGHLLGLVSANGNACGQVTVDNGAGDSLTAIRAEVGAVWCNGFFKLLSENNS